MKSGDPRLLRQAERMREGMEIERESRNTGGASASSAVEVMNEEANDEEMGDEDDEQDEEMEGDDEQEEDRMVFALTPDEHVRKALNRIKEDAENAKGVEGGTMMLEKRKEYWPTRELRVQ